jgi:hypothetical protein
MIIFTTETQSTQRRKFFGFVRVKKKFDPNKPKRFCFIKAGRKSIAVAFPGNGSIPGGIMLGGLFRFGLFQTGTIRQIFPL